MKKPDTTEKAPACAGCPPDPPWPKYVAFITFLPWPVIVGMALYILWHTSRVMLDVWLTAFFLFFVPLRYLICAPCPYYGKNCSTIMGRLVPLMFAQRPGTPLAIGLWLDIVSFAVLSIIPLPYAWRLGGAPLTGLWLAVFATALVSLGALGCRYCPFTYCPIGRASRGLAGLMRPQQQVTPEEKNSRKQ
ncbi:hypothetical protein [Desulfosudis oleivorans]|uniref:Uncharacterized protein n=1 Tax=Desulfosudis oleivorans (strain DSM 6200 / JCM 39069 / Hxd3) TaxID=96561 RepID=A8ZYA9_DESOH|nr:hypothetical protein [Desulfosudis oleivorans]ABW67116.1 hypothetical protein Dole_1310 [Desulfosudis oleivorans Hxd3]